MPRQLALWWGAAALGLLALAPLGQKLASGLAAAGAACPLKSWTGVPCPGCGTGRAALDLARLDLLQAFGHYPLPALAWTGFIAGGLAAAGLALAGKTPPAIPSHVPVWARVGIVGVILANWAFNIVTGV